MDPSPSAPPGRTLLARKLAQRRPLARADDDHLARVLGLNVARFSRGAVLMEAGERPSGILVVLEGWAARCVPGPAGRRQLVALHLPGDVCDFNVFVMRSADSAIHALSDLRVARIGPALLEEITRGHPAITRGLWWESMSAASVQRQWLVNLAQRNARARLAHLLCELYIRQEAIGLAQEGIAPLPLSQAELAGACGLTTEHVNRTLRDLREQRLCRVQDHLLQVHDGGGLVGLADFHPGYLHYDRATADFEREKPPVELAPLVELA